MIHEFKPLGVKSNQHNIWGQSTTIVLVVMLLSWVWPLPVVCGAEPIAPPIVIARPAAGTTTEFYRDVVPILRANCLPCHNRTTAKADLILESPADMLKGGESGPAIVIGKPAESLLLRVATQEIKPRMPPKDNKANARPLTSAELGLLELWIEQGAKSSGHGSELITWQALAPGVQTIAAVAVTADSRFAACGRGNRLAVYDLGLGRLVAEPAVTGLGAAHHDVVNAVALSPDGEWLASGGFREVTLWRRHRPTSGTPTPVTPIAQSTVLTNLEFKRLVYLGGAEPAKLTDLSGTNLLAALETNRSQNFALAEARHGTNITDLQVGYARGAVESARKELPKALERRQKAQQAWVTAASNVVEKTIALQKVVVARTRAELEVLRADRNGATNQIKSAKEKLEAAIKGVEGPEREEKQAATKQGSAEEELRLAELGFTRATLAVSSSERALRQAESQSNAAKAQEQTVQLQAQRGATNGRVIAAWFADACLITAHVDGSRRTWNPQSGEALDVFRGPLPPSDQTMTQVQWEWVRTIGTETNSPFADRINALAFRGDGLRLAVGTGDPSRGGDLHVLEPATGQIRYALTNLHSDSILAAAWSPDGRWLATGGADRMARIVDTASGRQERVLEGHTGHVLTVAWSPDGRLLATGGAESAVKFWEPFTDEKRKPATAAGKEITGVAFLSNDEVVAATGDPSITVWKVGGEKVRDYEKPTDYQEALAVSPDGKTIVAGGVDGLLRVWRGNEAKAVWTFAPAAAQLAADPAAKR